MSVKMNLDFSSENCCVKGNDLYNKWSCEMCWEAVCLREDPYFLCEWHTGLGEDHADQGWPGSVEGCHERKSPDLVMSSSAAASNTTGDRRIGT